MTLTGRFEEDSALLTGLLPRIIETGGILESYPPPSNNPGPILAKLEAGSLMEV